MRLNQFLAKSTALSRRTADTAITEGRVEINGLLARVGDTVIESDVVTLDGRPLDEQPLVATIMLHKPVGYVVSRDGQGSRTIYELLPETYRHLNPVGRLDKDSSGLLLFTNDGELANKLAHPRYEKQKQYIAALDKPLQAHDQDMIADKGVRLDDGISKLGLKPISANHKVWEITMREGRNRQIRRTFLALGYKVTKLHRTHFGDYELGTLKAGDHKIC